MSGWQTLPELSDLPPQNSHAKTTRQSESCSFATFITLRRLLSQLTDIVTNHPFGSELQAFLTDFPAARTP